MCKVAGSLCCETLCLCLFILYVVLTAGMLLNGVTANPLGVLKEYTNFSGFWSAGFLTLPVHCLLWYSTQALYLTLSQKHQTNIKLLAAIKADCCVASRHLSWGQKVAPGNISPHQQGAVVCIHRSKRERGGHNIAPPNPEYV